MSTAADYPIAQTDKSNSLKPIRLWPGVVILLLQLLGFFVVPIIVPGAMVLGVIGAAVGALAIIVWWLFFSRAPWLERLGILLLIVISIVATRFVLHESIIGGMMGLMFPIYGLIFMSMAIVVALTLTRGRSSRLRRAAMAASILLVCGLSTLVRTGGITAAADSDIAWRWSQTPEERLLAQGANEHAAASTASAADETRAEWPGFRGPDRDGVVRGVRIATDWSTSPPVEMWRRPIGPAWSSFAVRGDRIYTQEQRGDDELVSCYNAMTGQPVWIHRDKTRFYESNGGAGPRGTPTLSNGRVYTFGGTGILNSLDAGTGAVLWSRNAASDTKTETPMWGFASSPLIVEDIVVIATAGTLAAYDAATGEPRWHGPMGGGGYSSPHLAKIGGVTQIVMMGEPGVIGVAPADGKLLWQHGIQSGSRIVQPGLTEDGDLLISDGDGSDLHRIKVAQGDGAWKVEERWTSDGLKPFFNDFVVYNGHAYGFDNGSIACIDLTNGERKWAGGTYGSGQLVLLSDAGVLLVVSEQGSLALVGATPDKFKELAQLPAIQGKTWNHPVVAGNVLLVRNGQEMAAFRLPAHKI